MKAPIVFSDTQALGISASTIARNVNFQPDTLSGGSPQHVSREWPRNCPQPPPSSNALWIPGHWTTDGGANEWTPGHWETPLSRAYTFVSGK
jgi:hypothetical protein